MKGRFGVAPLLEVVVNVSIRLIVEHAYPGPHFLRFGCWQC